MNQNKIDSQAAKFDPKLIDPLLLDLITDLNNEGFDTCACCQGRRTEEEFVYIEGVHQHCPEAYVGFVNKLPIEIQEKATSCGLNVHNYQHENIDFSTINSIWVTTTDAFYSDQNDFHKVIGYLEPENNFCRENWTSDAIKKVIEKNECFIDNVRKAFNL